MFGFSPTSWFSMFFTITNALLWHAILVSFHVYIFPATSFALYHYRIKSRAARIWAYQVHWVKKKIGAVLHSRLFQFHPIETYILWCLSNTLGSIRRRRKKNIRENWRKVFVIQYIKEKLYWSLKSTCILNIKGNAIRASNMNALLSIMSSSLSFEMLSKR